MAQSTDYALPFALLTVGGLLAYSGFHGKSITAVLGGDVGPALNPAGGSAPIPAGSTTGGGGSGTDTNLSGDNAKLKVAMDAVTAANNVYKWGGGHATPLSKQDASTLFDCSGSVCYALYQAGYYKGPYSIVSGMLATVGKAGKGEQFTIYANATHVFIRDESSGMDWSTTGGGPTAPGTGPRWGHHSTTGFIARHYEGM